jgi:hypothetical protein
MLVWLGAVADVGDAKGLLQLLQVGLPVQCLGRVGRSVKNDCSCSSSSERDTSTC